MTNHKRPKRSVPDREDLAIELAEYLESKYGSDVQIEDGGYGEFVVGFINERGEILFGHEMRVKVNTNL